MSNLSEEEIINNIQTLFECSKDKKDVLYYLDKKFKESLERNIRFI